MFFGTDFSAVIPNMEHLTPWSNLILGKREFWVMIFQFIVVFLAVSWFYFKIHGTYAAQLLKGVTVILALYLIFDIFNFTIFSGVLQAILQISIIGFIILFQPELRRLLVYLGQPDLFSKPSNLPMGKEKNAQYLVHELMESLRLLSKTKTGALIVLESPSGLGGSYLEVGTRLDARLSTELLLTIFHTNTPLHDGAVVISPDCRIISAGVLLPLSENPNLSWKYGTRHRAAIGLSETSDCRCLIVSEETGNISIASAGSIEKIAALDDLKLQLEDFLGVAHPERKSEKRQPLSELFSSDIFQKLFSRNEGTVKTGSAAGTDDRSKINY